MLDERNVNSKKEKRLNSGNLCFSADIDHTPHICYKVKGGECLFYYNDDDDVDGGTRRVFGMQECVCDFYTVYRYTKYINTYMLMKFAVSIIPIQGDKCIKLLAGGLCLFSSCLLLPLLFIHAHTLQCQVVRNHLH